MKFRKRLYHLVPLKLFGVALMLVAFSQVSVAEEQKKTNIISGPFGSKPIQLSIGSEGITRKEGGYICDLESIGAKYSEWGETEKDARTIVLQACNKKSGILICKKDKITCKEDK